METGRVMVDATHRGKSNPLPVRDGEGEFKKKGIP